MWNQPNIKQIKKSVKYTTWKLVKKLLQIVLIV